MEKGAPKSALNGLPETPLFFVHLGCTSLAPSNPSAPVVRLQMLVSHDFLQIRNGTLLTESASCYISNMMISMPAVIESERQRSVGGSRMKLCFDDDTNNSLALVEDVWAARTRSDIMDILARATQLFGYDGFLFAPLRGVNETLCQSETYNNWPEEWRSEYTEQGFGALDPHLRLLRLAKRPYFWDRHLIDCPNYAYLASRSAAYGLSSGVMVPARVNQDHMASLSFHSGRIDANEDPRPILALQLLAEALAHKCPPRDVQIAKCQATQALSHVQTDILKWIHMGKTNWEISVITAMSYRTINYHVSEILRKLDVTNRLQAAAVYGERSQEYTTVLQPQRMAQAR